MNSLEKELESISAEAELKRQLALRKAEFHRIMDDSTIRVFPESPHSSTNGWTLILPRTYEKGRMAFSVEQHAQFAEEVRGANGRVDEYVQRHLAEFRKLVDLTTIKGIVPGWWEPVEIRWNTFALPNFMDSPQLGKMAYMPCRGLVAELPSSVSLAFKMVNTKDNEIKPFFYLDISRGVTGVATTTEFSLIRKEIHDLNPRGFEYLFSAYPRCGYSTVVETE
ncbi:MAG: hypothetical protein AABX96_02245 [Nanoarchaeota archaeon]